MNGNLYFEEHPWDRACSVIAMQDLGKPVEIAIQVVCESDSREATLEQWMDRCEKLTGAGIVGHTLQNEKVVSVVGRAGACIIRIFIDSSDGETTENFEIVTEKSLLVWKPGTSLQGRSTNGYTCCKQQYVSDLEVKA